MARTIKLNAFLDQGSAESAVVLSKEAISTCHENYECVQAPASRGQGVYVRAASEHPSPTRPWRPTARGLLDLRLERRMEFMESSHRQFQVLSVRKSSLSRPHGGRPCGGRRREGHFSSFGAFRVLDRGGADKAVNPPGRSMILHWLERHHAPKVPSSSSRAERFKGKGVM